MRLCLLTCALLSSAALAQNQIPPPSQTAQGEVAVTIYNNNQALVQDRRQIDVAAARARNSPTSPPRSGPRR